MKYRPINYTRMIDTRLDGGPLAGGATKNIAQGNTVIAAAPSLILTISVASPTNSGHLIAYADATPRPSTSSLNYVTGQIVSNLAIAATGNSTVDLYNNAYSSSSTHVVVDCLGYFAAT